MAGFPAKSTTTNDVVGITDANNQRPIVFRKEELGLSLCLERRMEWNQKN